MRTLSFTKRCRYHRATISNVLHIVQKLRPTFDVRRCQSAIRMNVSADGSHCTSATTLTLWPTDAAITMHACCCSDCNVLLSLYCDRQPCCCCCCCCCCRCRRLSVTMLRFGPQHVAILVSSIRSPPALQYGRGVPQYN